MRPSRGLPDRAARWVSRKCPTCLILNDFLRIDTGPFICGHCEKPIPDGPEEPMVTIDEQLPDLGTVIRWRYNPTLDRFQFIETSEDPKYLDDYARQGLWQTLELVPRLQHLKVMESLLRLERRFQTVHPSITSLLRFFAFEHLPPHLGEISRPFGELAQVVADRAPDNPETTVALRKLLEAKDCAVRAALP